MKLKELKRPTYSSVPDFSMARKKNPESFTFGCEVCNGVLKINFQRQINACWQGKTERINEEEDNELKRFYNIGLARKSHEGGLSVFDKIYCSKCQAAYVTYCGVIEIYNSLYSVQVQGILKIEE